ncbi:MAG: hypothetical protein ABJF10_08700 [Chthoniobacter sp.]|uniref:hypothetical protein n=1 Tax=Chthoniobacter sp. TaxID=2510640 RepID=UPI0032ADA2B5
MSLFDFFRRPKQKALDRVIFNADSVTRFRPDGVEETIRWDDLHEVGILTTDEGPWLEDVFFLLIGSDGKSGCVVPQLAEGCKELVERLQRLPNFNNEALIKAMGSAVNAQFVCWKRQVS